MTVLKTTADLRLWLQDLARHYGVTYVHDFVTDQTIDEIDILLAEHTDKDEAARVLEEALRGVLSHETVLTDDPDTCDPSSQEDKV
jgi:hypothetical protein